MLGPSGVGKTSVLDIMHSLRQLLSGEARVNDRDIFPTRTLTQWQSRDLQVFEIDVQLQSETYTYRLEVEHQRTSRLARIRLEKLEVDGAPLFECVQSEVQLYRDDPTTGISRGPNYTADWRESALARVAPVSHNRRLTRFLDYMRRVFVCAIHPPDLQAESAEESALLFRDARNFADWYRHMLQERPDLFHDFSETLTEVIGNGFRGIRLERLGQETRALMVAFAEQLDAKDYRGYELPFDEISDGQRALIVLYGLIHLTGDLGYTLFLDEPDNYVALREIQPWLMGLEDACGDTLAQAVISSHHPELIDYLGRENGVLLLREASGAITTRRLKRDSDGSDDGLELSELFARGWES